MEISDLLTHIYSIKRGEAGPMARYLAEGGEVTPAVRTALVQHLRNPKAPAKRSVAQQHREMRIVVAFLGRHLAGMSRAEAIRDILKSEPNLTPSTIENYLRNFANKSAL